GALEVAQALRSAAADPRETAGLRPHGLLAARLDVRQLELLTEDLGEFLEADVDLEDVLARVLTRLSGARLLPLNGVARLAVALADTLLLVLPVAEPRELDLRQGDADRPLAPATDHLARRHVTPQV